MVLLKLILILFESLLRNGFIRSLLDLRWLRLLPDLLSLPYQLKLLQRRQPPVLVVLEPF